MLWFLIAVIIAVIVFIKRGLMDFFITLVIGFIVALLLAIVIRYAMPDQFEVLLEENLVKMSDSESYINIMNNDNTSNNSSSPTLVFTVTSTEGAIITYKTSVINSYTGNSKTIIETDMVEPKYIRQKMRPIYKYWRFFAVNLSASQYVIYIPKDSIEYDYNVK